MMRFRMGWLLSVVLATAPLYLVSPALAESPGAPSLQIRNEKQPAPGVISGGQPTAEQLERAAELGYRSVINLRTEGEEGSLPDEAELVETLGMRYVAIPVAGAKGVTEENMRLMIEALEAPGALPVLLHCGSGNRIGALYALKALHVDGLSAEEALQDGKESGLTRLEPVVRELLGLPPAPTDETAD